ncbi:hypothetical protein STCU_11307 [Strigomonas culicis]|uniref:Uncharacterized protein n=1 Tax=Strigomonas culicis TaxID=28005 RepID=S9V0R4_9TRYP|nr:hypothetical protein STCU_11307 [Strigomonas culicis]|eukprot:EPY16400.1 hypothetical protein STCU_11307 [Strigomonas culicis]
MRRAAADAPEGDRAAQAERSQLLETAFELLFRIAHEEGPAAGARCAAEPEAAVTVASADSDDDDADDEVKEVIVVDEEAEAAPTSYLVQLPTLLTLAQYCRDDVAALTYFARVRYLKKENSLTSGIECHVPGVTAPIGFALFDPQAAAVQAPASAINVERLFSVSATPGAAAPTNRSHKRAVVAALLAFLEARWAAQLPAARVVAVFAALRAPPPPPADRADEAEAVGAWLQLLRLRYITEVIVRVCVAVHTAQKGIADEGETALLFEDGYRSAFAGAAADPPLDLGLTMNREAGLLLADPSGVAGSLALSVPVLALPAMPQLFYGIAYATGAALLRDYQQYHRCAPPAASFLLAWHRHAPRPGAAAAAAATAEDETPNSVFRYPRLWLYYLRYVFATAPAADARGGGRVPLPAPVEQLFFRTLAAQCVRQGLRRAFLFEPLPPPLPLPGEPPGLVAAWLPALQAHMTQQLVDGLHQAT